MTATPKFSWLAILIFVAFSLASTMNAYGQCYLSQGCKPVDNLTYGTNGNGQVYHGDGASNNGAGGWTTNYSDVNQCLGCHYGTDTYPYLQSGHKNTLRKLAPGVLWAGPDGASYLATDDHYGSGSIYDWTTENVTLGWCTPLATPLQNGHVSVDAECKYPYYTLPNSHAPAPYTPVAPTVEAGGVRNMFYLYGGWLKYGGSANPADTHLGSIFDQGFTGGLYPDGNFDCARCHATGYNFDASAPEPTQNTNSQLAFIPDARFKRVPTDGYLAPNTNGTSSWYLTGVQCERCHVAAKNSGSHPWGTFKPTTVRYEAATALCMECHRQEDVTHADTNAVPPIPGSIAPSNVLKTNDRGYCSDMSGSPYATCIATYGNAWVYKPRVDHEQGQAFLNSPHARFTGNITQNAQHSADLSITIAGTYSTQFSELPADHTRNSGCTGCHDPHKTTVAAAHGPNPISTQCNACHRLSQNIMKTINHPIGPGTPFPTGLATDVPGACIVCHMEGALGTANSHLVRINPDVNYRTFPTPDQLYLQNLSALNTAPEISPLDGTTYPAAAWLDVDLACGQCHVGNDGITNAYGLTLPPEMPGAHAYTRAQLAYWAANMHSPDPGVPTPTFAPPPTTYHTPITVTISDSMSGAVIYFTTDGSLPTRASAIYSAPIAIATTTTVRAMATYPGYPQSLVALATYSIVLPTAPAPAFQPLPSTYATAQSVKLSNTAGLPMYYTTDGSTPTTSSTLYTVAIAVSKNTTIRAISAGAGYLPSSVSVGAYFIQAPAPNFSKSSGTYYGSLAVTISDTISAATIYYTTDGSSPSTASTSCANPCALTVSATTTLKAIATGGGYAASNITVAAYTIAAAAPTFSLASGTYYTPQSLTILDATPSATIYYTTDGSYPSTSSASCLSPCPITIATTTTVKALATAPGVASSSVSVATYTIAANTPTFAPGSGTYSTAQSVTISDATSGVTIYYTTDGSFPTTSSTPCAAPCHITVSTTTLVKAIAAGNGYSNSSVAIGNYTITGH